MKKLLLICFVIMGIALVGGCIDGENTSSITTPTTQPVTDTGISGTGGFFGETKISDNISVSGLKAVDIKTLKIEDSVIINKGEYGWIESGYIYYFLDDRMMTLYIALDLNRDKIENLAFNWRGNIVNNFRITKDSSSTYVKADLIPGRANFPVTIDPMSLTKLPVHRDNVVKEAYNYVCPKNNPEKDIPEKGIRKGDIYTGEGINNGISVHKKTEITILGSKNSKWDETKILYMDIKIGD